VRYVPLAIALALAGAPVAWADEAEVSPRAAALEAACMRMVTECAAARQAANRDPMTIENPPGVLWKTTSPAATRHVVNAIAIARDIRRQFGTLPEPCARACDGFLR
jgi:hypothetical protein